MARNLREDEGPGKLVARCFAERREEVGTFGSLNEDSSKDLRKHSGLYLKGEVCEEMMGGKKHVVRGPNDCIVLVGCEVALELMTSD